MLLLLKQCNNKNQSEMQDMIHAKGQNWNNFAAGEKRGRIIFKETYEIKMPVKENHTITIPRTRWIINGAPIFTSDGGRKYLKTLIPTIGGNNG